jgi:hypothetical protein
MESRRLDHVPPKVPDEKHRMLMAAYPELEEAIEHAHGTDDPVYAPHLPPWMTGDFEAEADEDDHSLHASLDGVSASLSMWLPKGFHWGLHIEHRPLENAGPMTQSKEHKGIIHTTQSPWEAIDAMFHVLDVKRASPGIIYGGRHGLKNPVLIQTCPLNIAGRALEHPAGTPPTNTAACVQMEWCYMAEHAQDAPEWMLKGMANAFALISHRYHIAAHQFGDFAHPKRVDVTKHYGFGGHSHVLNNIHWDPGKFKGSHFVDLFEHVPSGGYNLHH